MKWSKLIEAFQMGAAMVQDRSHLHCGRPSLIHPTREDLAAGTATSRRYCSGCGKHFGIQHNNDGSTELFELGEPEPGYEPA